MKKSTHRHHRHTGKERHVSRTTPNAPSIPYRLVRRVRRALAERCRYAKIAAFLLRSIEHGEIRRTVL